ncbi:MAG: hypothetical protein H6737_08275 [Alphaproteobacteria bacterium]|nr:hypothetical protein [Alphaproteobacteria bacterium]
MNANRAILAGVVALAALGLLALGMSGGDTGPEIKDHERTAEVAPARQKERRPAPSPTTSGSKKLGANGQSVEETLKTLRQQGLPERPPEGSPLDEGSWQQMRREADEVWHDGMMEGVEQWASKNGYDRQQGEQIMNEMARFTKRVVTIRDNMRAGRTSPDEGRDSLENLRMEVAAEMISLVGEKEADDLNGYLATVTTGGGW